MEDKVPLLDDAGQLDCVDGFCYLEDIGPRSSSTSRRVRCFVFIAVSAEKSRSHGKMSEMIAEREAKCFV